MQWPLAPIQGDHAVAPIYTMRICDSRWHGAYTRKSCGGAYIHNENMRWPLAPIEDQ